MSSEELRRERQETYEELRRTQDVSGSSNFMWRGLHNKTRWDIDYGGWYSSTYTAGDNGTDRSTAQDALDHTWEHDERFFLRVASASKKTTFYARLRMTATHNHTSTASIDRNDWAQPTFDMFYFELGRKGRRFKHTWTFGRQYTQVERGISFGMVADGIRYEAQSGRNELQFFWLVQPSGDNNYDASAVGWNPGRTKRWFGGAEWQWKPFLRHKLGLFLLNNIDRNRETADGAGLKHQLDSLYYGLGLSGSITGRWSYWTQYIQQTGTTYSTTAKVTDMKSSAMDLGMRYFFPTDFAPTLYCEYATGSGDNDATGSATTIAGGSAAGNDERFISFGGLSLGYALAPQLINIKVTKFGASVKPFGWSASPLWSDISFQPTFYTYNKDKAAGDISDPVASATSKKIGSEVDVTVAWRLSGDLKYQLKWGRFSPGSAYPAGTKSSETYLKLKLSLDL